MQVSHVSTNWNFTNLERISSKYLELKYILDKD